MTEHSNATPEPLFAGEAWNHLICAPQTAQNPNCQSPQKPSPAAELWREAARLLEAGVEPARFRTWIAPLSFDSLEECAINLKAPNQFCLDWVKRQYIPKIEEAVSILFEKRLKVHLSVGAPVPNNNSNVLTYEQTSKSPELKTETNQILPRKVRGSQQDMTLTPHYRFSNFVTGPSNRLAHAAALAVSENPGQSYNPLFLHGSVGLGKTHLLQAICHEILDRQPDANILYVPCEDFVNEFIQAISKNSLEKFREKYRNTDMLVIDDIHFLSGKERTQEEFFHTFNSLYNAQKQIVLACDSAPHEIPDLEERMVSRFQSGLVAELEPPHFETRAAILKDKARQRGCELNDEVIHYMASIANSNIRELEGCIIKVLSHAKLMGQTIDLDLVRQTLKDTVRFSKEEPTAAMVDIKNEVSRYYGITVAQLVSSKRSKSIAYPRQVGMFLARELTRHSLEEIGESFGGRDHTTVLYSIEKIRGEKIATSKLAKELDDLTARLKGAGR